MNPYNLLIRFFIYIRLVPAIRLYTTIFGNTPPPCANPYIPLISCNLIPLIIHYHFKKSTLIEWIHIIYLSDVSFTSYLSLLLDSTLLFFGNTPPPCANPYIPLISCNMILFIIHYHFKKYYWVNPYNLLISCFIFIRPVHAIRLYTNIFENAPSHCENPYIPSIDCNMILFIIHYH